MLLLTGVAYMIVVSLGVTSGQYLGNYNCEAGRDVMVHLFEWKWSDVAQECEDFLADAGYCGVQISPPHEHRLWVEPDVSYPWWQRYQPVSYILDSRSGTEDQFIDMVQRCNLVGVRIYADTVINHMAADGSGIGSGGTEWNADEDSFPGVPYQTEDFHNSDVCFTDDLWIHDYNNPDEVRYCRLNGLRDLRHARQYVLDMIQEYMNRLIGYGVAGFRIDAAKHMFPDDLEAVYGSLDDLSTEWFPAGTRPFVFQEVIDLGGEPIESTDYTHMGRVTEFKYGKELGDVIRKNFGQRLAYLENFGEEWGLMSGLSGVAFLDNHDNQRGHGAGGFDSILTFFDDRLYKMGNAYELAWNYGYVRIMSSYNWDRQIVNGTDLNDWVGPPSDENGNTNDVNCTSEDWICEHRWRQISNMVKFHNAAVGEPITNWWDNGWHAIAFGRGDKAFIAINNELDSSLIETLSTNLPDGEYCDVISCLRNRPEGEGNPVERCGQTTEGCRGVHTVTDGQVNVIIGRLDPDPVIAFHV